MKCIRCGAEFSNSKFCPECGAIFDEEELEECAVKEDVAAIDPTWPHRSKTLAAIFAIFFGWAGIHHFYLGQPKKGLAYLLFCWTGVTELLGIIDGVKYLKADDMSFQMDHCVRL